MPIYAYRCSACGHAKDVLQKISDPLLTTCPACGAETFSKQLTAAGFQLKGSGWYVTDFRNGNSGAASSNSTTDKPATENTTTSPSSESSSSDTSAGGSSATRSASSATAASTSGAGTSSGGSCASACACH